MPHCRAVRSAGVGGFEPPRCSLTGKCSAAELHAKNLGTESLGGVTRRAVADNLV